MGRAAIREQGFNIDGDSDDAAEVLTVVRDAAIAALLAAYLHKVFQNVPCHLRLIRQDEDVISWSPGWTLTPAELTDGFAATLWSEDLEAAWSAAPTTQVERRELIAEAKSRLNWRVVTGELPDWLGRYRILLPCFEPGSKQTSPLFARFETDGEDLILHRLVGNAYFWKVLGGLEQSWAGTRVTPTNLESGKRVGDTYVLYAPAWQGFEGIVEVSWRKAAAGSLTADRLRLDLSPKGEAAIEWLRDQVRAILEEIAGKEGLPFGGLYAAIAAQLSVQPTVSSLSQSRSHWLKRVRKSGDVSAWGPVHFPVAICHSSESPLFPEYAELKWQGRQAFTLLDFDVPERSPRTRLRDLNHFSWLVTDTHGGSYGFPPDRLVFMSARPHQAFLVSDLWLQPPSIPQLAFRGGWGSRFPPTWQNLVGTIWLDGSSYRRYWNTEQLLWTALTPESRTWIEGLTDPLQRHADPGDPRPMRNLLLHDHALAAAWLLYVIGDYARLSSWRALVEQEPRLLRTIWQSIFGESAQPLCFAEMSPENSITRLAVFDLDGALELSDRDRIARYLPDPGPEWNLDRNEPPVKKTGKQSLTPTSRHKTEASWQILGGLAARAIPNRPVRARHK